MDESSIQLHRDLQDSIHRAFATQRPVLTHLNADTTWLLQIPYPQHALPASGRTHFNILIDPWLQGPQSDIASWFSKQWHVVEPSVKTIADLDDRLRDVQEMTQSSSGSRRTSRKLAGRAVPPRSYIDVVVISHEFTDHCHRETLEQVDREVPILATAKAAEIIRSWDRFALVLDTPTFPDRVADWRTTSLWPLPDWLGISRLVQEKDMRYLHSALLFVFNIAAETTCGTLEEDAAEAIVYSPHGSYADQFRCMPSAIPPITAIALVHGLDDMSISSTTQLNLGAHKGLRLQRLLKAKYWVATHDERKKSRGILAPFLWRRTVTFEEALEKERTSRSSVSDEINFADIRDVRFAALQSGESLLLE